MGEGKSRREKGRERERERERGTERGTERGEKRKSKTEWLVNQGNYIKNYIEMIS